MLARKSTILDAAFLVFSRYGYKRSTMNDIASEAGVARQTLYNAFANKETILRAIIRQMTDAMLSDLERVASEGCSLDEAIEMIFNHTARIPFDTIKSSPHAQELIDGFHAAAQEELQAGCEKKVEAVTKLLSRFGTVSIPGASAEQIARLTVVSALLVPKKASDSDELEAFLSTLKALVSNAFHDARA